jgi:antitoxin (DNA-binding transcriptional repressor) of toxin-antitoxin stability system
MKTATVRELRNNFAELAKWLEWGEQITITRNGEPLATPSPPIPKKISKADWTARFQRYKPVGKGISKAATDKLWSDLRD